MDHFHQTIARLGQRAPAFLLAAVAAVAAAGLWLFFNDMNALEGERRLRDERAKIELRLADDRRRVEQLEVEVTPARERVMQAEKVIRELRQLTETWQWFGGNRAQHRANQERLQAMEALRADVAGKADALQRSLRRAQWARDGHEIELGRIDAQLRLHEIERQGAAYWLRRAWLAWRSWVVIGSAGYLLVGAFAPAIWRRWHTESRLSLKRRSTQRAG
jgi:hypothetical protein